MEKPPTTAAPSLLDDLPHDVLLRVFSVLPVRTIVHTSLISRKWRHLWSSFPSLYFPFPDSATCRSFVDFVNRALLLRSHRSPLHKFHLEFDFKEPLYSSHLDSWIRYAILHETQELHLDFFIHEKDQVYDDNLDDDLEPIYEFPFFLLRNGCVSILKLIKCEMKLPGDMATMGLKSLGSLFLDQVCLTDKMVADLVSGCVNLERLVLEYCYGMRDLKICSTKLKDLSLCFFTFDDGSLEVSCPNLGSLKMVGFEVGKYDLNDVSRLVMASVIFFHKTECYGYWSKVVQFLGHVKQLTVQNWWLKLLAVKDVFPEGSLFQNLNHLELRTGYSKPDLLGLAALLELSPNLETMTLDYLCNLDEQDGFPEDYVNKSIDFKLPCLKQVKIKDYRIRANETYLVTLLILHGVVLEKIILVPPTVDGKLLSPIVMHRRLKQHKYSEDILSSLKFKNVGGEISICVEE